VKIFGVKSSIILRKLAQIFHVMLLKKKFHVGGVDLADQLMSWTSAKSKTRRWTLVVLFFIAV